MKYEVELLKENIINTNNRVYPSKTVKEIFEQLNKKSYNVFDRCYYMNPRRLVIGKTGKPRMKDGTLYVDVTLQLKPSVNFIALSLNCKLNETSKQFKQVSGSSNVPFHEMVTEPKVEGLFLSTTFSFGGSTNLKKKETIVNNE
jgi:hypothetical protein